MYNTSMNKEFNLKDIQIYVISLKDDIERLNQFLKWCEDLNFLKPIVVPGVISTPYYTGLAKAYYNALSLGLKSKKPFIIMEDDAFPTYDNEDYVISIPEDADAFYLGAAKHGVDKNNPYTHKENGAVFLHIENNLFKIINTLTTHAIFYIKESYTISVIDEVKKCFSEDPNHIDLAIANSLIEKNNVYFIKPFFYQNDKKKVLNIEDTKNIDLGLFSLK